MLTLLIMAAGMGSRFGGDKQVEVFGENGKTLLEFSISDAQKAGFTDVVIVIRPDLEEIFKNQIIPRIKLPVQLVYQTIPAGRTKPWGTAEAVWVARDHLKDPFMVINADDYYSPEAYYIIAEHLPKQEFGMMVAYQLGSTLSEHGSVSRGVCQIQDNCLKSITECTKIQQDLTGIISGNLAPDTLVSMNCWGFQPSFLSILEEFLVNFWTSSSAGAEAYLPSAVSCWIDQGAKISVFPTNAMWLGITYQQDLNKVKAHLIQV